MDAAELDISSGVLVALGTSQEGRVRELEEENC